MDVEGDGTIRNREKSGGPSLGPPAAALSGGGLWPTLSLMANKTTSKERTVSPAEHPASPDLIGRQCSLRRS